MNESLFLIPFMVGNSYFVEVITSVYRRFYCYWRSLPFPAEFRYTLGLQRKTRHVQYVSQHPFITLILASLIYCSHSLHPTAATSNSKHSKVKIVMEP